MMTGGGGCKYHRRRKTAETKEIENSPNFDSEITEKPPSFSNITKLPLTSKIEFDFYTQACKALSFRPPFISDDPQVSPASVSGADNTLPCGLSNFLSRHTDSRKRQKKSHTGSEKKSSAPGRHRGGSTIWFETEDYFRELTIEDVERLYKVSRAGLAGDEKCFLVPCLGDDDEDEMRARYDTFNRMLASECEKQSLKLTNGKADCKEMIMQQDNKLNSMDVDGDEGEDNGLGIKEEGNGERVENGAKDVASFSGVEWLLGSKSKIYLASERPSRKRKLLGRDAGLEKLLVARPIAGLESVCHYCSCDESLNCLIKCGSCGMVVHKRCYGVQEKVDSSWLCSWCKRKDGAGLSTENPCVLCPKQGGALKPVQNSESSELEFAHLFCCQWIPEAYVENTRTMEPISNLNVLRDTRKKLVCCLCKLKSGSCVRCSKGACRTSFHPICAREARYRMEIWGKIKCDEVELRAFCSKHSEIQHDSSIQNSAADLNDIVLDGEDTLESNSNSKSHEIDEAIDRHDNEDSSALNFILLLKKLIDLQKVDAKAVASEMGVSPDVLNSVLSNNHMVPELHSRLIKWLKNNAHIGSLQKSLKLKIRPSVQSRTKSNIRGKTNGETTESDLAICLLGEQDSNGSSGEVLIDHPLQHKHNSSNGSFGIEDNMSRFPADDAPAKSEQTTTSHSLVLTNRDVVANSYIHPIISSKLMQTKTTLVDRTAFDESSGLRGREVSLLEASSSSILCCNNQSNSSEWISKFNGENQGLLKLSPADEVEGELIYYQQRLILSAVRRKCISDDLMSKVIRSLPHEIDFSGKQKWDSVLVSQYNQEMRETKKLGRKERRHKEAQAVLAAATAAAAASSRISAVRKETIEEEMNASPINPRVRETTSMPSLARPDYSQLAKEHSKACDICRRSETILNPILVCSSCKVSVHLDCYRSIKSKTGGPWHCELCEDFLSPAGPTNSFDKPCFFAECGLCGGTAGAFRKAVDGKWVHALCAEWVLESTYRRGQVNPIEGVEPVPKGVDDCVVCHRKQGVCLKCSYGHCHSTFHPICARSAGFYMITRTIGGKLQHKAYCEKHSLEQRTKVDTQTHGIEEFRSLKQVRVELERLRLLCDRIIKREKLKRELVLCSHAILASSRDSVLSALARHPFYQPDVSSESATTSIKVTVQKSDDVTVDSSAVSGKRRIKIPLSIDNDDQRTDDSSTSQNVYVLKPTERVSNSGKQITHRISSASTNLPDDLEKRQKYNSKHTETFEKELVMTSDQASMKNQRLPKGFVYVPIGCLSKDKETMPDASSREQVKRDE